MLEHGQRVARIDTLIQLAGAMSISPTDLIEGIGWAAGDVQSGAFDFTEPARQSPPRD